MAAPEASRDTSFCSHALLNDEVMVVEDAACDPRFAGNPAVIEQGLRFYAGAPLTTAEGFRLGTLCVMDHLPRKLSRHDRQLLRDMAAIVMGEMELRHCLGTDPLTGLYTHHFFHEVAGRELIRARREARPLAAAFVKPDDFQRRKDRLSPEAGDMVLPTIASAATRALRDSDLLGRRHEAGFVLLLPATSLRQAVPVLERLRQEIEALVLPEWKGQQITVSIGVSELAPEDLTVSDLLTRADVALHRARGGNRLEQAA
jgi:diguanylate cyclase (GGDEF)-like protein